MNSEHVQYGCGLCAPKDWRNFDTSPTLRLQKLPGIGSRIRNRGNEPFPKNVEYGDIVRGLPVPANSCRAVYCSHVLEHLSLEDFRVALRNTHTYLAEGGIFRFVLPDLEKLAQDYLDSTDPQASLSFMEQAHLGRQTRAKGLSGFVREWMGNSAHFWMWDYKSMVVALEQADFHHVRRAQFGDSGDPRFTEVEELHRWEGCLGVECVK